MATPLVHAAQLSQAYSGKTVFRNLDLAIHEGERIGLIGPNGSGKSTLMQILAQSMEPDEGKVTRRKDLRVSYVAQTPEFDLEQGALTVCRIHLVARGVAESDADVRANTWLSLAGFADPEAKIKTLSGGWCKRLQIVTAMAEEADLTLLDEPTNHLDMVGVEWLEDLLQRQVRTWMTVSHDRFFLQRTTNRIVEIDAVYPDGAFSVDGDYEEFVRRKAEFMQAQHQQVSSLASKVRREDAWLARGPKARTTKAKGRIDQAMALKEELGGMRDRLRQDSLNIEFSASGRKTKKLIELEQVSYGYGEHLLIRDLDCVVRPGNVLGVLGENGTGKTTLLKLLAGELQPQSGSVTPAIDLRLVYFDQNRDSLDPSWTLARALSDAGDSVVFRGRSIHVVTWAKRFRFAPEQLDVPVAELSGGERARVLIARLMLRDADVLILDEPTNDLDIPTLEILEDSLADFPGAVVMVTHDRYMLENLCNEYLGFCGGGIVKPFASQQQWRAACAPSAREAKAAKRKPAEKPRQRSSTRKLSYMEQREYDGMEEKILVAEEELAAWEAKVEDPDLATQSARLQEACEKLELARTEVQKLYDRWAELEAKVESLDS